MAPRPKPPKPKKKNTGSNFKPRFTRSGFGTGPLGSGRTRLVQPGYKPGDEMNPAGYGAERITSIQKALIDAGYADSLRAGQWDKKSQSAYAKLLSDANNAGVPADQMLMQSVASQKATDEGGLKGGSSGGGGGGGGSAPKQGTITKMPVGSPLGGGTFKQSAAEDLQAAMRNTFNDLLAMDPSAAEEMVFIADQRAKEIWQQAVAQGQDDKMKQAAYFSDVAQANAAQAAVPAAEGGADVVIPGGQATIPNQVVTEAPNPQAVAEMIARTKYPMQYAGTKINKRLGEVLGSLQQAPNVRPMAR